MSKKRKSSKPATRIKMTLRPAGEIIVTPHPTLPAAPPDKRIHERRLLPSVPEGATSPQNQAPRDRVKPDPK